MAISQTDSPTDRALLAALRLWAGAEEPALLLRLGHQRARELAEIRKRVKLTDPLATLREAHRAQMAPDLARVHYTWLVRALQEETASIQRVVVAAQPELLRARLLKGLKLDTAAIQPDHPAAQFAVQAVQSLWLERLVGDVPPFADDLPIVRTLASLSERSLYRLVRLTGMAKLAKIDDTGATISPRNRGRLGWFNERTSIPADERLRKVAIHDWQSAQSAKHHALAAMGLTTWARLLVQADDYRLRWVLQHLPYPVAKRVRGLGAQPQARVRAVNEWEADIFGVACERLQIEGKSTARFEPQGGRHP